MGIRNLAFAVLLKTSELQEKEFLFSCVIVMNINAILLYKKIGFTFHRKIALDIPYFKEELKGIH
jgi:hypothetical protein